MHRYYFLLFLLLGAITARAQVAVHGKVHDENAHPLPFATVLLHALPDSQLVQGAHTDSAGRFVLPAVKPGNYFVKGTFLGYQPLTMPLTVLPNQVPATLRLQLKPLHNRLAGVTIESKKPSITHEAGKVSLNVAQSPLAQSQTAFELLKDLPGVTVSKNGEVKIKGKSGVTVMIDGEPVVMGGSQLKALLASMPGTNLQSMEVMDHPPASMDAAGNAGVINIRLKQRVRKGWSGTLTNSAGMGKYVKTDHSASVNYGNNKWNFNALGSYSYDENWSHDSVFRQPKAGSMVEEVQYTKFKTSTYMMKLGVDHYLRSDQTLSAQLSFNRNSDPSTSSAFTRFLSHSPQPDSMLHQLKTGTSRLDNWDAQLKYKRELGEHAGFNITLNGTQAEMKGQDEFMVTAVRPQDNDRYINLYPSRIRRVSLRGDFHKDIYFMGQQLGGWEAGFKSSISEMKNRQSILGSHIPKGEGMFGKYRFRENIHALYASMKVKHGPWELRGGLRAEMTDIRGDSLSGPLLVTQRYTSLFPEMYIGHTISSNYKIGLQYSRRIERPDYEQLNPVVKIIDPYTTESGNPQLRPQFSDNIELQQQFLGFIDLSAGVSILKNPLFFAMLQEPGKLNARYTTVNVPRQLQWTASLAFPVPVADWWENYHGVYFNYNVFNTQLQGQEFNQRVKSFGCYTQNSFRLPAGFNAELSGWYEGGNIYGNLRYKPMAEISVGVNKDLVQKKCNAALSVSDLFFTSRFNAEVASAGGAPYKLNSRYESRMVKLTLTWNFGKKRAADKTPEAAEDDRIPSGKEGRFRKTH